MFPQRRKHQRNNIKPVEQIRAEFPILHLFLQIFIRGGQKTNIDLDRPGSTYARKFTFLKHAKKFGLQNRRQFSNLIEEQAATLGDFDHALLLRNGAGERAFFMAKQLAFQKSFRDSRAIQSHEWMAFAIAVVVSRASGEFFARSAFAADQHGGIAGSHALNELVNVAHAGAASHHVVLQAGLGAQLLILNAQ